VTLIKPWREVDDARIAPVRAVAYYHDAGRRQLRRATGPRADAPVLDGVVGLSFRYFGDPAPPASPRPATGSGVATCLFNAAGAPALPALTPDDGAQIELTEAMLTDGPWCGSGPAQFDADLYRIRRLRVTLRLHATASWARGPDARLFAIPGTATNPHRLVPDFVTTVDITPRNLQP
jgi:hypothetical protein